jgi:hypothetical protein
MLVFHYLRERFPRRSGQSPSRRGTHHHQFVLGGVRSTARGTTLIFPAPDRGTAAILSAIFGVDAGRIRPCTRCQDFFLVPARSMNQQLCRNCVRPVQDKSPRGGFLGAFAVPYKQLRVCLTKRVERGTLTPAEKDTLLRDALQDARQERRRGASPQAWQKRWREKIRQPMGRPRKSHRRGLREDKDLRAG